MAAESMTILDAVILGIVEGLTEFLPVSSTGHLILTKEALGLGDEVDTYLVGIQIGAVMAVVTFYWSHIVRMLTVFTPGRDVEGLRLLLNLFVAFLPAAVVGLLFDDLIDKYFFNTFTVALALIVGGVIMLVVERLVKPANGRIKSVDDVTLLDAFLVGCAQCFSLWPGMSRSMSTIVGAQLRGFTNPAAADFSFLLSLPTLGAATLYSLYKGREELLAMPDWHITVPVGIGVAFVVAWLAIAGFLTFVKRYGMGPFGWYRLVVGGVILVMFYVG